MGRTHFASAQGNNFASFMFIVYIARFTCTIGDYIYFIKFATGHCQRRYVLNMLRRKKKKKKRAGLKLRVMVPNEEKKKKKAEYICTKSK